MKDQTNGKKLKMIFCVLLNFHLVFVLNYLGYTDRLWNKPKKAEDFIREAIKIRPKDGYFIDSLGWAYYRQGKYDPSFNIELEKAVELILMILL